MAWSDVFGQQRVASLLARAIETGRVAHAYLFHGPPGVGKRAMALEFARALQCESGTGPEACGACPACGKVGRLVHPDVHLLFPHPADTSPEDIAERTRRLAENPYEELDYVRRPSLLDGGKVSNKQSFYSVERVDEDLRRALSFRSHEGKYKVAILIDADALRTEAANAVLKILEEPPGRTVFILTTERADRMLPTIVSRCQRVRFSVLAPADIAAGLSARVSIAEEEALVLARMAGGSFTRALQMADSEALHGDRGLVLDFFRNVYIDHSDHVTDLAENVARMGREQVKGLLMLMLQWIRDLMLFRDLGNEAELVNADQKTAIARFCQNVPEADLPAMVAIVEEAMRLVGRNVNMLLVILAMAQALHSAMHGKDNREMPTSLVEIADA